MIELKLDILARRIGKTATDVAKETGLNRNTINSLFNNKVDGIKFETLDKICQTYKVAIADILELKSAESEAQGRKQTHYKQEGSMVPFTGWPWMSMINGLSRKFFEGHQMGTIDVYFKNDYAVGYWNQKTLKALAEFVFQKFNTIKKYDSLYSSYERAASNIVHDYKALDPGKIHAFSKNQLKEMAKGIRGEYDRFWELSLFIDAFDTGVDQQKIKEISEQHGLTLEEAGVLLTPEEMTFNNDRLLALLEIVKEMRAKKIEISQLNEAVKKPPFSSLIDSYIKDYDYYRTNYAQISHITKEETISEIRKYLQNEKMFSNEYEGLIKYGANKRKAIAEILKKHGLRENPLWFFNKLTFWREHRKMVNLMGFHILDALLAGVEIQTGIPKPLLGYMTFDEFENVLHGTMSAEILRQRREDGVMFLCAADDYTVITGSEAESLKAELEAHELENEDGKILYGQVASQGYSKGVACVVLSVEDFGKFKEGNILVTGMTRPEFVPIMKKAAAIVTNEGGITCHAAIVSRELGKPCIIGTKIATQMIKDGDLIEVRANHGTVRILNK